MGLADEYFVEYEKYKKKYGEKTILLMQVGSFYECYGIENETEFMGCVTEVADLLNIVVTRKDKSVLENSRKNPLLCGIPCHALPKYKDLLTSNNYTIVIMDQTGVQIGKGSHKHEERKVTEILSAATELEDRVSPISTINNIISLFFLNDDPKKPVRSDRLSVAITIGISCIDISTGRNIIMETYCQNGEDMVGLDETYRFLAANQPRELIINTIDIKDDTLEYIKNYLEISKYMFHIGTKEEKDIKENHSRVRFQNHFLTKIFPETNGLTPLEYLDMETKISAATSYVLLLNYIYEHNSQNITSLLKPEVDWGDKNRHMILTYNSISQLNLISSNGAEILGSSRMGNGKQLMDVKNRKQFRSLFEVLNKTSTSLGKRLLFKRLVNPSIEISLLESRYSIIDELHQFYSPNTSQLRNSNEDSLTRLYETIETHLTTIGDLEKYNRRMGMGMLAPMDFVGMHETYIQVINMRKFIESLDENKIKKLLTLLPEKIVWEKFDNFRKDYQEMFDLQIMAQCIISFRKGKENKIESFFKTGVNPIIDKLQNKITTCNKYLQGVTNHLNEYLQTKTSKTDSFVKIQYSDRDKYHLSTTPARGKLLKEGFEKDILEQMGEASRKFLSETQFEYVEQTNGYKILTKSIIMIAENLEKFQDEMKRLTKFEYQKILQSYYSQYSPFLSSISSWIAEIDFLKSLAKVSLLYGYCKPTIIPSSESFIFSKTLRHPLFEHLTATQYIGNDVHIGHHPDIPTTINGMLVYGCNSSGKSLYMKAIPCNLILAQIGCFVAATSFTFSPFKQIMTRISGDDNAFQGNSSFTVEMKELRTMLKHADKNTLCVGDELCRGTESLSGIALVGAAVVTLAEKTNYIFATHLHELASMEEIIKMENVKSYHLLVTYDVKTDTLIFNRKLEDGPGNNLYGLEMAASLNLGKEFIELATTFRNRILRVLPIDIKKSKYNKMLFDKCFKCNSSDNLHVHHINEQKDAHGEGKLIKTDSGIFHKDSVFNTVPLCEKCHQSYHKGEFQLGEYQQTSNGIKLL